MRTSANLTNKIKKASFNIYYEKYLENISSSVKLFSDVIFYRDNGMLNYEIFKKNNLILSNSITLRSAFNFFLNYHLGYSLEYLHNQTLSNNIESFHFSVNKVFMKISFNFLKNRLLSNWNIFYEGSNAYNGKFLFSTVQLKYRAKKLDFYCNINNLFNTEIFFRQITSDFISNNYNDSLLRRKFTIGLKYIF